MIILHHGPVLKEFPVDITLGQFDSARCSGICNVQSMHTVMMISDCPILLSARATFAPLQLPPTFWYGFAVPVMGKFEKLFSLGLVLQNGFDLTVQGRDP